MTKTFITSDISDDELIVDEGTCYYSGETDYVYCIFTATSIDTLSIYIDDKYDIIEESDISLVTLTRCSYSPKPFAIKIHITPYSKKEETEEYERLFSVNFKVTTIKQHVSKTLSFEITQCACGIKQKLQVTWKNWDDEILSQYYVSYGDITYPKFATPTKEDETKNCRFVFKGWDQKVGEPITEDTTFTAQFKEDVGGVLNKDLDSGVEIFGGYIYTGDEKNPIDLDDKIGFTAKTQHRLLFVYDEEKINNYEKLDCYESPGLYKWGIETYGGYESLCGLTPGVEVGFTATDDGGENYEFYGIWLNKQQLILAGSERKKLNVHVYGDETAETKYCKFTMPYGCQKIESQGKSFNAIDIKAIFIKKQ